MVSELINCTNANGDSKEVPVNELEFRPSIYAVVIKDGNILLSRQWDGYDFPGGAVDKGETLDEALEREVREETGLSVKRGHMLFIGDDFFIHPVHKTCYHSVVMYFTGEDPTGEIATDGFTETEKQFMHAAEWVPLERIDSIKFYNPVDSPALIRAAIEGKTML